MISDVLEIERPVAGLSGSHGTRIAFFSLQGVDPVIRTLERHYHGPENAKHELHKAYNEAVDSSLTYTWERKPIPGLRHEEVPALYKLALQTYRDDNKLAAERWARAAKHLARAFFSEAKIAFLERRAAELPFLEGATDEELGLLERPDAIAELLDSYQIAPGPNGSSGEDMRRYLARARQHLQAVEPSSAGGTELLRVERIKAAHEYGRTLECMTLAYEASRGSDRVA